MRTAARPRPVGLRSRSPAGSREPERARSAPAASRDRRFGPRRRTTQRPEARTWRSSHGIPRATSVVVGVRPAYRGTRRRCQGERPRERADHDAAMLFAVVYRTAMAFAKKPAVAIGWENR